jgi:hypothetical protein
MRWLCVFGFSPAAGVSIFIAAGAPPAGDEVASG